MFLYLPLLLHRAPLVPQSLCVYMYMFIIYYYSSICTPSQYTISRATASPADGATKRSLPVTMWQLHRCQAKWSFPAFSTRCSHWPENCHGWTSYTHPIHFFWPEHCVKHGHFNSRCNHLLLFLFYCKEHKTQSLLPPPSIYFHPSLNCACIYTCWQYSYCIGRSVLAVAHYVGNIW